MTVNTFYDAVLYFGSSKKVQVSVLVNEDVVVISIYVGFSIIRTSSLYFTFVHNVFSPGFNLKIDLRVVFIELDLEVKYNLDRIL